MNARMKGVINAFHDHHLEPDEPFRFHCTLCGKCCINREDILLNPKDMYNLAKELKISPGEVLDTYCDTYIGDDSRFPVVRLRPQGTVRRCPLLKDRKCSVHKAKPTICALFPIGRGIAKEKGNITELTADDIRYFFTDPGCGDDSETHTVREWLAEFDISLEDPFFLEWTKLLIELSQQLRRVEKRHQAEIGPVWSIIASRLYLMYDVDRPFEPQFQAHQTSIRKMMQELIEEDKR